MKRERTEPEMLTIKTIAHEVIGRSNLDEVITLIDLAFQRGYVEAIGDAMKQSIISISDLVGG